MNLAALVEVRNGKADGGHFPPCEGKDNQADAEPKDTERHFNLVKIRDIGMISAIVRKARFPVILLGLFYIGLRTSKPVEFPVI